MYSEPLMNGQEDGVFKKKKKVNGLADRSEIGVSCDIDTERVV